MIDMRTAVQRVLRAETNRWTWDFAMTIVAVPQGLLDGKLTEALLDAYPAGTEYPYDLSRAIAHQVGLKFPGDPGADDPTAKVTGGEGIGMAVEEMRALREGEVACLEDGTRCTWQFYRESVEAHGITAEQVGEYTHGMTWTEVAQLLIDAHNTPIADADRQVVVGTGGFVNRWLRPGDYTYAGPDLEDGQYGIGITGGVTELVGAAEDLAEFGERVAMRWQSPLVMALADLGDAFDRQFAVGNGDMVAALSCGVVDALAKVLARAGSYDTAARMIAEHSRADDEDEGIDRHQDIHDCGIADEEASTGHVAIVYKRRNEAADRYLRELIAD